ncbi:MAG: universal stress protein [Hyphomicrobiales bacterium]
MTTSPTCIIAVTSEDGRFDALVQKAKETAARSEARLILYDLDAADMFASPLPTEWSGERDRDRFGDKLDVQHLEAAGREPIAAQVREARAEGIEAFGWLPSKKGADALAEYAEQQNADLIMVPASEEDPGFLDKLRGATVGKLEKETNLPIAVVDEQGAVEYR